MIPSDMRLPILISILAMAALNACGGSHAIDPAGSAAGCAVLTADARVDTIRVGLLDDIQPAYAPWAHNAAEKLVFHHLYETLFVVDCKGDIEPGLARSWRRENGGERWVFELQRGARFWDGSRVEAGDVVTCWQDVIGLHAGIDSVESDGRHKLVVYVSPGTHDPPRVLSSPAFAVSRHDGWDRWPMGSGAWRLMTNYAQGLAACPRMDDRPVLVFRRVRPRESRDLLENDLDLLVTSLPSLIDYARSRPHLTVEALPWDRTYLLLSISRSEALRIRRVDVLSRGFRKRVARDAVQADTRACENKGWWDERCGADGSRVAGAQGTTDRMGARRVVYDAGDHIARDLAERIIALGVTDGASSEDAAAIAAAVPGIDGGNELVAQGLARGAFALSLRAGDDFCYIVPVPYRPADACYETRHLIERAPWLAESGAPLDEVVLPLVDARDHVIARRDRVGVVTDWYANVMINYGK